VPIGAFFYTSKPSPGKKGIKVKHLYSVLFSKNHFQPSLTNFSAQQTE